MVLGEELPGADVAVVHAVQYDAHALVGGDECADAYDKGNGGESAVAAAGAAEAQDDASDDAEEDGADTEGASKEDAGWVAVADGPADEVGVGLAAECRLDGVDDEAEGGGVSGVSQSLDGGLLLPGGEVELARGAVHDVSGNDTVNLFAEGLDCDCSES